MRRLILLSLLFVPATAQPADNWPEWRGPAGDGISAATNLPTIWSPDSGILWKTALPQPGNSTPVVWRERIFLTQPQNEHTRSLVCFELSTGKQLWDYRVEWTDPDPTHSTNPICSSSAATDGTHVVAWFGAAGLHCCDLNGHLLWKTDTGSQKHIWGYGTSPVIRGNMCYLNFGPGENSAVMAFDINSGELVWKHEEPLNRDGTAEAKFQSADYTGSWSTPLFTSNEERSQLIVSLPFCIRSFNPETGSQLWSCEGTNALCYTSPVPFGSNIVAMGGYNGMTVAVPTTGSGDVTQSRLWRNPRTRQRIGSAVYHEGHLYIHDAQGIAQCIEAETGKTIWEQRLNGAGDNNANWSSVLLADGLCYSINQSGDCFVFRAQPTFELVAVNSLAEQSNSSIIPAAGTLLIRTHRSLWCVGSTPPDAR